MKTRSLRFLTSKKRESWSKSVVVIPVQLRKEEGVQEVNVPGDLSFISSQKREDHVGLDLEFNELSTLLLGKKVLLINQNFR